MILSYWAKFKSRLSSRRWMEKWASFHSYGQIIFRLKDMISFTMKNIQEKKCTFPYKKKENLQRLHIGLFKIETILVSKIYFQIWQKTSIRNIFLKTSKIEPYKNPCKMIQGIKLFCTLPRMTWVFPLQKAITLWIVDSSIYLSPHLTVSKHVCCASLMIRVWNPEHIVHIEHRSCPLTSTCMLVLTQMHMFHITHHHHHV